MGTPDLEPWLKCPSGVLWRELHGAELHHQAASLPMDKGSYCPHKLRVRASRIHWENFGVRCTGVAGIKCFLEEYPPHTPGTPACDHLWLCCMPSSLWVSLLYQGSQILFLLEPSCCRYFLLLLHEHTLASIQPKLIQDLEGSESSQSSSPVSKEGSSLFPVHPSVCSQSQLVLGKLLTATSNPFLFSASQNPSIAPAA